MSAVASWTQAPLSAGPTRRHLQLVPPMQDDTARGRVVDPAGLRLTVRGRRVLAATVLALLIVAGWGVGRAMASGAGAPASVTVQPGQTLSQVAHAALPHLPVREAVVQFQLVNNLNSLQVHAGQQLTVPR